MADTQKRTMLISYDLHEAESKDYDKLFEYLKKFGTWAQITESTWAIQTVKTEPELRDEIVAFVPEGSSIFVSRSSGTASWNNVQCSNTWLQKFL